MNMLKLLQEMQEMRGPEAIGKGRPVPRTPALLAIPIRLSRNSAARQKRIISIMMRDMPAIPAPVKITHLRAAPSANQF